MNTLVKYVGGLGVMAGLLLSSSFATTPAVAASIIYNFTGDVTGVDPLLSSRFSSPSTMKGSMTVDVVDQVPGSSLIGLYNIESFSVTIGGYTATLGPSPAGSVIIFNGPGGDSFSTVMDPINGGNVNFLGARFFSTQLFGPSTVLSSDALPMSAPSVASFTTFNQFRLGFGPEGVPAAVSGVLTSLTAVPLPAAVILFGVGLVALIGLGAGGLRNLRVSQA